MKKVQEIIKKNENISIILFIILMIIGFCTDIYVCASDEIWNFQNIYKMLNGYKIYINANVITTPLFHFVGYLFLKVFLQNILFFRIYNILIMTTMYFLIYKILKKLTKNDFLRFCYFAVIIIKTINICSAGANYNVLAMDFVLLGIFLNLIWIERREKHNIIQGIIMFLVFFTKQNIGVFYILGICLYQIIKEKKLKDILKQLIIIGILIGIMTILFIYFGIFNNFINYAILGISEFAQENIGGEGIYIIQNIVIISFIVVLSILLIKKEKIHEQVKNKLLCLSCVSIPLTLVSFPIYNNYHITLGNIVFLLNVFFILDYIFFSNMSLEKYKKIIKLLLITIILMYMYASIIHFVNWINNSLLNNYFDYKHPFFGGYLNKVDIEEFKTVTSYITSSKENIIILTEDAALYMVPLKRNNGAMDLLFLGNLGKDGENKIIKEIEKMRNTKFLIKKDENNLFWQESKNINNYIKENLNYIGDIEKFSIYEKK